MNPESVRAYRPGDWFAILGARVAVLLPPEAKPRVAALWELVDEDASFEVVLDALLAEGLRELPAFVLVAGDRDRTAVLVRGDVRAELRTGDESVVVDGASAATWAERSVGDPVEQLAVVVEDDPLGLDTTSYTVDRGLFRVSRFEVKPARSPEPPDWIPEPPAPPAAVPPPPPPQAPQPPPPPSPLPPPPPVPPVPEFEFDEVTEEGPWVAPAAPDLSVVPQPYDTAAPVARLLFSNGDVVDVDGPIVIGRAPDPRRSQSEDPHLVVVPSPHLEISSTHIEVRPGTGADLGAAVVIDLGSTNGTVVVQPGIGPEDLIPALPVQLLPGALIDIGDGVTIQVATP